MKRYTDAKFEVVSDSRPKRHRRDPWEAALLVAATLFALYASCYRAAESHNASSAPAPVAVPPAR